MVGDGVVAGNEPSDAVAGYERVRRLGRGGMGVVDLARTADGTEVALKRLTLHGSADDIARARQRVEREAEVLRRLDHPNIVRLLDLIEAGDDADGEPDELTLVMPYLPGGTLADRVAAEGPLPPDEVAALADQLERGLAEAHRAGIVHRDLKPANVLFDADGVPHLADFGVASSRDDTAGLTQTGTVVGTPGFMAPEQARGEGAGQAADVFALGATLLFALTAEGPYGRGAPDLLMVRAAQDTVRSIPRSIPRPLRDQLAAMLDPRPDRRPTAAALVGGPDGTMVAGRPPTVRRRGRWRPPMVALVVLIGVALVAATIAAIAAGRGDDPSGTTATTAPRTPTTAACVGLRYQPCGQAQPAAGTDGRACLATFADYDGVRTNGCEAVADGLGDDEPFPEGAAAMEGTIVPRDDVDTFAMPVGDGSQLLCDGRFVVTLTAPAGMTLRLEVQHDGQLMGQATSADGIPASVTLKDPQCLVSDAGLYIARVSPIGSDRTGARYVLERHGSF